MIRHVVITGLMGIGKTTTAIGVADRADTPPPATQTKTSNACSVEPAGRSSMRWASSNYTDSKPPCFSGLWPHLTGW